MVHPLHAPRHRGSVTTVRSMVCVWNRSFEQLAETFILGSWPFQSWWQRPGAARWKRPTLPRPFRTPWYPFVPIVFLLTSAGMLVSAIAENPRDAVLGTLLILGGVPVYYLLRAKRIQPS